MDFDREGGFKHFSIIYSNVFEYLIGKEGFWNNKFKIELMKFIAKLLTK